MADGTGADGAVAKAGVDLSPGARRLVHVNGRVQPGEVVLIVTDPTMGRYAKPSPRPPATPAPK